MTRQPNWKLIAQLGDRNPIDHGGYFIYQDTTGVYQPEAEVLESFTLEDKWTVHRFILEPCTFINGVLSDNKFHPDKPAWFAECIKPMCDCMGQSTVEFIAMITDDSPVNRAIAWRMIGDYHGFDNLDSYPLTFTSSDEVEARYAPQPSSLKGVA